MRFWKDATDSGDSDVDVCVQGGKRECQVVWLYFCVGTYYVLTFYLYKSMIDIWLMKALNTFYQ